MIELHRGDCVEVMRGMADGSVHCCVTSPPYFGLRDYQTGRWEGGDPACDHKKPNADTGHIAHSTLQGGKATNAAQVGGYRDTCGKCGARRIDAQIGLERTPDLFVARMVEVFREVRRVLRDDGTLWLNLGDSFAGGAGGRGDRDSVIARSDGTAGKPSQKHDGKRIPRGLAGLKPKDLIGIPWRVAFALQADGWYLRSDIVWHKPNPMPESVRDRPTKSHEYLFLLSKSERYYFDADAVREPVSQTHGAKAWRRIFDPAKQGKELALKDDGVKRGNYGARDPNATGRNMRSVLTIATKPYKGAHFATFPPKLVEPCVRAGTSERGCCPRCGKPWERVVERGDLVPTRKHHDKRAYGVVRENPDANDQGSNRARDGHRSNMQYERTTLGWRPACSHGLDPVPCVVLDPFAGSGTVGQVADALGRRFIGIDLNAPYLDLARRRIERPHLRVPRNGRVEHLPLFDRDDASSPITGEHP